MLSSQVEVLMKIATLLLAAIPLAAAADGIAGRWAIDGDVAGQPVNLRCTLAQPHAPKFTGQCTLNGGDSVSLEGELKGGQVTFAFTTDGYTLNYTGAIEAGTMKGEIEVAGTGGAFTAKRTDEGGTAK
jgi:hypothetical protein